METNRPLGSDSVASTDQIAALSKRCLDQKSKVDVAVQQLENLIASVEQKRAPFQAEVNKVGAELQNLLRNRIDLLNQQSSNICAKTVERLNQQKSVLTTISERLEGACSYSLAAMNSSSNESVMRARKQSSETLQIVEGALYNSEKLRPCENDGVFTILDKTACLKAISSLGVILPPEEAIGRPGQPRLCQSTATSLILSWDPPPTKAAILTGYTVFVSRKQQQEQQELHCGSDPRITVGGLSMGTTYMVSVRAESNGIHGRSSPFATLSTPIIVTREFTFSSNWDHQGIMWWLGTTPDPGRSPDAHTPEYVNPHGSGLVVASWSSTCEGEPQKVLDRDCNGYNCTNAWGRAMNWWQVDLRPCGGSVCPSKYSVRNDKSNGACALRSWDLLGSNDGATWTTIKRHANDQALDAPLAVGSWDLPASTAATTPPSSPSSSFSVFRLAMTGPSASGWNCNGNDYLMIAGFEIYGLLTITTNP